MQPDTLSQPLAVGGRVIPNRLVMPPMVIWKAAADGLVSPAHLEHYRGSAGPGLIIVEATAIAPEGRLAATQLGIWSDAHVEGLSSLAAAIREAERGSLPGIQIHHAGGATSRDRTHGEPPLVPSLLPSSPSGAREFDEASIAGVIDAFRAATVRAAAAGFACIELHAAHGYLISQFLSPAKNRRDDRWGGSPERRRRFLVECVAAARAGIDRLPAESRPLLSIRLGAASSGKQALPLEEGILAAQAAVDAGCDLIHVSNGGAIDEETAGLIAERFAVSFAGSGTSAADWRPTFLLAALVRRAVAVPVIGVNGIREPSQAASAVSGGLVDMVAVGRGLLADPGWARKALGARSNEIERCRDCEPRCHWFTKPSNCPARAALASRGELPPVA